MPVAPAKRLAYGILFSLVSFQAHATSAQCIKNALATLIQSGLSSLDHPERGWAILDVSNLIDPAEVKRIYWTTPNETRIGETSLIQNLETGAVREGYVDFGDHKEVGEIGVNIPLPPSLLQLIKRTMNQINSKIPTDEAGRLSVKEARLRRTDGSDAITPTTIHRDRGYMVVNVTLLGDGSVLFLQDKELKEHGIETHAGQAVVFAGKDRAEKKVYLRRGRRDLTLLPIAKNHASL